MRYRQHQLDETVYDLDAVYDGPDWTCHKCGKQCCIVGDAPAICEDCCEDHEYEYDRDERGWFCKKNAPLLHHLTFGTIKCIITLGFRNQRA